MAKDQGKKVTNFNLENFISYDELQIILNEFMDDFHKVLKNYFSISNENFDLIKEVSNLKEKQIFLTKEKELHKKEK